MADNSPSPHPLLFPWHSGVDTISAAFLRKIIQHAIELLDLEDCTLALFDEQKENVVLFTPNQEQPSVPLFFPWRTSPLAAAVEKREPCVFTQARMDAHLQLRGTDTTHALACVPLLSEQRVLGVLTASASTSAVFTSQRVHLLELLAEQAVLTLFNARQAELMRDADRMKANFLSLVTHELRSPLNTINGYLDLTLEGLAGTLNEQQREFLQRARAGSENLYVLIEDLLLASRADAGQLRLNRAPVALSHLVGDTLEELELTAKDAEVSLKAEIPADFPHLRVDAVRMQQVLRNLLSNALQRTPAGGQITVSACHDIERKQIEIRVTDTGYGIEPAYHERIFERFFQVPHAEGSRMSGQGLGLAIVKMIVELHGGQIRVESMPGEGCTFILTLPPS